MSELQKAVTGAVERVNHPDHYNAHPAGVECITVVEGFNFNVGNAIKYLWRWKEKNGVEDLRKAVWYINRLISKQTKG
jgi:hypothetical protein